MMIRLKYGRKERAAAISGPVGNFVCLTVTIGGSKEYQCVWFPAGQLLCDWLSTFLCTPSRGHPPDDSAEVFAMLPLDAQEFLREWYKHN